MSIRNTIAKMRSGLIGSLAYDGPKRVATKILDSTKTVGSETSAVPNVFGHAFTLKSEDSAQAGGDGQFIGILINPHAYAIDSSDAKNGTTGELLHMGEVFVKLYASVATGKTPTEPVVGGKVYFVVETGALTADATDQAATATAHTEIKGAVLSRHKPKVDLDGNFLAVVSFTGLQA